MSFPIVVLCGKARGKDAAAKVICDELGGQALALADPMKRFLASGWGLTEAQLWGNQKEAEFVRRKAPPQGELVRCFVKSFSEGYIENNLDDDEMAALTEAMGTWARGLPEKTTPRHMLQTFGTECVRFLAPDLWIEFGLFAAQELLIGGVKYNRAEGLVYDEAARPANVVAITDGRFRNELIEAKQLGALCVQIKRAVGYMIQNSPESETPVSIGAVVLAAGAQAHASELEQDSIPDFWFDHVVVNDQGLDDFVVTMKAVCHQHLFRPTTWTCKPLTVGTPKPAGLRR
jgi:hypothetical protein